MKTWKFLELLIDGLYCVENDRERSVTQVRIFLRVVWLHGFFIVLFCIIQLILVIFEAPFDIFTPLVLQGFLFVEELIKGEQSFTHMMLGLHHHFLCLWWLQQSFSTVFISRQIILNVLCSSHFWTAIMFILRLRRKHGVWFCILIYKLGLISTSTPWFDLDLRCTRVLLDLMSWICLVEIIVILNTVIGNNLVFFHVLGIVFATIWLVILMLSIFVLISTMIRTTVIFGTIHLRRFFLFRLAVIILTRSTSFLVLVMTV